MDPISMRLVADDIIMAALREDITFEDVSTASVCPTARPAEVQLIAKGDGVIAGLDVFARTFALLDPQTRIEATVADGDEAVAGASPSCAATPACCSPASAWRSTSCSA